MEWTDHGPVGDAAERPQPVPREDGRARGRLLRERRAQLAPGARPRSGDPDLAAYRAGYDLGLETYCRDSNGFAVGARGAVYEGVCPTALEGPFLNGYRQGHHLYELQSAVSGIDGQIAGRRHQLHEVEERLAETQTQIISDSTPADQRAALLVKAYELSERHGRLESEIAELERSLGTQQEELRRFRESLAYNQ